MDTGKLDAIDKFGHPFQTWLRRECFKKPTPEAFDLARSAWKEQDKRIAELEAGYRQAIEDIEDWADYANYYLTGRDEFDCSIEAHRKTLEGE